MSNIEVLRYKYRQNDWPRSPMKLHLMEFCHWFSAVLLLLVCHAARRWMQSGRRLPPSPPRNPILGHALKIPQSQTWVTFAVWGKQYGSVISAEALGRTMIIVNSVSAARDLMEKKSTNYSARPRMTLLSMIGWDAILPTMSYGTPQFKKQRRLMQQYLGPSAVRSYDDIIEDRVRKFLRRLLLSPENFYQEIHGHIASIVVQAVYGHEVTGDPSEDSLVVLNEQTAKKTTETGNAGATIIDLFPFLRHVPSWIPGMGLKRRALEIRVLLQRVISSPFEKVKTERTSGTVASSVVSRLLEDLDSSSDKNQEEEADAKNFAMTVYLAGTDTTRTVLQMFFLMMVLNQDVQKRAREEIDRVIGLDRLPLLSDRANLPYIECIMRETLRIHPPIPLGIPHSSVQEDEYRGWSIPARSMIIPNIWYMMRDEETFLDPEKFDPDRHAANLNQQRSGKSTADDVVSAAFGFGRRFCPGRAFAESMMWITIANVLAAFDILPYEDPTTGKEIPPDIEFESVIVNSVKPFKCRVVPRKERLERINQDS